MYLLWSKKNGSYKLSQGNFPGIEFGNWFELDNAHLFAFTSIFSDPRIVNVKCYVLIRRYAWMAYPTNIASENATGNVFAIPVSALRACWWTPRVDVHWFLYAWWRGVCGKRESKQFELWAAPMCAHVEWQEWKYRVYWILRNFPHVILPSVQVSK